jgi:hypothetical protein
MRHAIVFLLLFTTCLATLGQSWDWTWTHQLKGADGVLCQVVATDDLNQSYLLVTYEDTLVMGDTTFRHPYNFNHMQSAIGIFDQYGNFRKAMNFFCPVRYQDAPSSVKPENSHSILIGGTYSDEYLASDTILFTENSNVDAFIGKYNESGKHTWIKTIKGPNQDYLTDFIPGENGTSYVIGSHTSNNTPVWVNFFGADSVQHRNTLIYVLKLDPSGNIIWKRVCESYNANGCNVANATLGADGNIYIQGKSRSTLFVGQDTLRHGVGADEENFLYAYDSEGNVVHREMRKFDLYMTNFYADADHNILFGGFINKTTIFANDTIVIPPDHFPCILGKMDLQNNLLWYNLFDPPNYNSYHWLEFSVNADTIYATLTTEGGMIIGDSAYSGPGRQTLIMQYSTSGIAHNIRQLHGTSSNYTYRVIADQCSDILIGGLFTGMAYNGADTLKTTRPKEGYIGRIKRWTNAIDIGRDTTINYSASIILSAGNGYDKYQWSTGEQNSSIEVRGSVLGAGQHKIWVSAFNNGCESRDTITVTVKNNIGIAGLENKADLFQIYPNPVIGFATIEYELSADEPVLITIFDFTGRQMAMPVHQKQPRGRYKIQYDTGGYAPGIYFCQLRTTAKTETIKMIVSE